MEMKVHKVFTTTEEDSTGSTLQPIRAFSLPRVIARKTYYNRFLSVKELVGAKEKALVGAFSLIYVY